MRPQEKLREEIDYLGRRFGAAFRDLEGQAALDLVEGVRGEARRFGEGDESGGDALAERLAGLSAEQLRVVVSAFSGFLELANLAEDRERVRALRAKARANHPRPRGESVRDAIATLKEQQFTAARVQSALDDMHIELVFTAHPTEAKRQSLRSKLRTLRHLLAKRDSPDLLPAEQEELESLVSLELSKLWQTDLVRPMRPTVLEEVRRGLAFLPVLWRTAPQILKEARAALQEFYPDEPVSCPRVLQFGSWMGGDRDGHPNVTPEITQQTVLWLRSAAIEAHRAACARLLDSLSMACVATTGCGDLVRLTREASERWPELVAALEGLAPREGYRRWLRVVMWRLQQTGAAKLTGPWPPGAYRSADELLEDLEHVRGALIASGNARLAETELQEWLDQLSVFGLQYARLDIRQHSKVYAGVMEEIWRAARLVGDDEPLTEQRRMELLLHTLPVAENLSPVRLTDTARETLTLFRTLRRVARRFGMSTLGAHVVSMTHNPSDVLTVLWLWKWSERTDGGDPQDAELRLPIVPLLETIDDLRRGPQILADMLAVPEYREHVRALGDQQMVMIGYSDSTKDGGYLAANWALQRGQLEVFAEARREGVHVTFFHGRGGALGRGGGPAARAILSLPGETFDGSLRLTEQGEVLADRYDDPNIAHRHLEQVFWSVLMASTHDYSRDDLADWRTTMDRMADASLHAYRELVESAGGGFVEFFRSATPIDIVEQLPIGSRPSKRQGSDQLEDLRAIPWVFSWTQCRCLLPAWFGVGVAVAEELASDPAALGRLREMYQRWRFFRATIDNTELALAKANMPVFRRYVDVAAEQSDDPAALRDIAEVIFAEFQRTQQAILQITGGEELLDEIKWLQRSIQVRNRYVDPLNFVQVELMRRSAAAEAGTPEADELDRLSQLAIKGIAAGMRTTG